MGTQKSAAADMGTAAAEAAVCTETVETNTGWWERLAAVAAADLALVEVEAVATQLR